MNKQRTLSSPFGEASVAWGPAEVTIDAPDLLGGDWALGWWHGQACGDEAVFARSFWRGTLGAGNRPSAARTEIDTFVGHWSFKADLGLESSHLPLPQRARLQAYADGFNEGRRRHGKEDPWSPEDCHLLARTLGFLEWWESRAPVVEFLLQALASELPWAPIVDLWPGLGPEPDRRAWDGVEFPRPFSPEARTLVNAMRRFRPGQLWIVPANRAVAGRPLLGASWVSDVTEPGLPFTSVRIRRPEGTLRGLSRPGHPGFLAGRTQHWSWAATPVVDDSIDLRVLDRAGARSLAGVWAGGGRAGTLQALLTWEECTSVEQARVRTEGLGSAPLDVAGVDRTGGTAAWALGSRWSRPPREAWLPTPWGTSSTAVSRTEPSRLGAPEELAGRVDPEGLQALVSRSAPLRIDEILAPVRFLLPDTEDGRRLRQWTGDPPQGPAAQAFERLAVALWDCFWEGSPVCPAPGSPVVQALLPQVDRLLRAPHSAWLPSADKNRRLAEAVRRAFAPGAPAAEPNLRRLAPRALWTEVQGAKPRVLATTVAVVTDPGEAGWRVFLTDDESLTPEFRLG